RGLQNYYRFVDNWKQCSRIQYILKFSLAKTLAQKYKISVPKVFKRFGRELSVLIKGRGGKPDRQVSFYQNQDWAKKQTGLPSGKPEQHGCCTNPRPAADPLEIGDALVHLWRSTKTDRDAPCPTHSENEQ